MSILADDNVVVHGDAERGGDVDDRLGHLDVCLRWRRIAGGMVVQRSNPRSIPLIALVVLRLRVALGSAIGSGKTMPVSDSPAASRYIRLNNVAARRIANRCVRFAFNTCHQRGPLQTSPKCPRSDEPQAAAHCVQTTAGEYLGHFSRRAMASVRDEGAAAWLQPPRALCGREFPNYVDPDRARRLTPRASSRGHFRATCLMAARRNGGDTRGQSGSCV